MCHLVWEGEFTHPTELQSLVFTLIFKVSARICVSSTLFRNLSHNVFFKYRSAHINKMFMLCLLENSVYVFFKYQSAHINKMFMLCLLEN
jgi:hypothetical protein